MLRNWVFTDVYKGILGEEKKDIRIKMLHKYKTHSC